jgi:hypothetical protein
MNENKDEQIQRMMEMKEFQDSVAEKYGNAMGGILSKKEVGGKPTETDSFTFFVDQKIPEPELAKDKVLPKSITLPGGRVVATDVVEGLCMPMGYIDGLTYQKCSEKDATANATKTRPIRGGTSILSEKQRDEGLENFGTLGCLVVDNEDGTLCALTNAHVACGDVFIPRFAAANPKPADQLTPSNVVNANIFQGTESDGMAGFKDSDSIGIVKRYSPLGARGSTGLSGVPSYGGVDSYGRPKVICDAALIALKASVVDDDSWKQLGITSQGASAPSFVTWSEYITVMHDSGWGSFSSDVNSSPTTGPKMFVSSRTTGPKEGDPEIEFTAPMRTLQVPYKSTVSSVGYSFVNFDQTFSYGLKLDAKGSKTLCHNPMAGGDSGSVIWVEINGTWKILGLAFASWHNPKTGDTKLGFAIPMPIVEQVMNISAWDGNKSTAKFSDTGGEFNVEKVITKGLGKEDHYIIDNKKYFLGGTVLNSKSRAQIFEPTYLMDHNDGSWTTNIIQNDWLSRADDSVDYEGRIYFSSLNNSDVGGYPVAGYTWITSTGNYIFSAELNAASGSPYEGRGQLGWSDAELDQILATNEGYGISGCNAQGEIADKAPVCLDGAPITWESRRPGIYDTTFKVGADGENFQSLGGVLSIPSEFKSFYITLRKYNGYDPIKISYDDTAVDGFDYTNLWDLKPYVAALGVGDLSCGALLRDAGVGVGVEIVPKSASLIFPIFKWSDIEAAGLEAKTARYLKSHWDTSDAARVVGWQMGSNAEFKGSQALGVNANGDSSYYANTVHREPTFIPLFCLEPPSTGGILYQGGTGFQEHGWIGDTSNNGDSYHSARSSTQGWIGNSMYGGSQKLRANHSALRTRMKEIDGRDPNAVQSAYFPQMLPDNRGNYWYKDDGYRARYYVLNPRWVDGMKQWRSRHGIPEDSQLSTPYGHEFTADSSITAAGEDVYGAAKIDKKLEGLSLLTETITSPYVGIVESTGSWVTDFTT